MTSFLARLLRPGATSARDVRADVLWLLAFALILIATGVGLRDPWPADEPRFALVAHDMLLSGEWLIPQVGADIYSDKPPLFFWLMSVCMMLTRSLRIGFLLPSLFAGIGCVVLIYDLARRLWNRETGLIAGLTLLVSVQFVWQERQAQIDGVLCFWTTLSLYALLRHCLLGPAWKWYAIGWAAAGFGIISKGVGFLPLLVLIPFALMQRGTWTPRLVGKGGARWLLGPLALIAAVSIWLAPMLIAAQADPLIAAYRNDILFHQTIKRYASAWHHREPFWYFIVQVIPALWLPLTALVPWLWSHWRAAWQARDLRVVLPLIWVVLVVLFFSFSSGKRGVYVLPGLPALVLASAPAIAQVALHRGAQRTLFALAVIIALIALGGAAYLQHDHKAMTRLTDQYDIDSVGSLWAIGIGVALVCAIAKSRRGFAAWPAALTITLLVISFWITPLIDESRSGAAFVRQVEAQAAALGAERELGFVAYKEQYLLYLTRPIVNFGHARWQEPQQEADDAAAWLARDPRRLLLIDDSMRKLCFTGTQAQPVTTANSKDWSLISGIPDAACVSRGHLDAARTYVRGKGLRGSKDSIKSAT
jgi:4-amino-4-deoxy-L-arabinose transferase-like glycosyltransferase